MEEMSSSMDMVRDILCRTCTNACPRCYGINSKICNFSTTIKDMIVLLVPQMVRKHFELRDWRTNKQETELNDDDVICAGCRITLIHCVRFINKCLRLESDRKEKGLCKKKSSLDIPPRTNLEDGVINKEVDNLSNVDQINIKEETDNLSNVDQNDINREADNLSNVDQNDINREADNLSNVDQNDILNGDFESDEETAQMIDIKIENNHGINNNTSQNYLVEEDWACSIPNHNRLVSAELIRTDKLKDFIRILASNDIPTIQLSQNSGRTTEKKRIIIIGSTFQCSKCKRCFNVKEKYLRHLRVHTRNEQKREERERLRKLRIQKKQERKLEKQMNGPNRKKRGKNRTSLECKTCSKRFSSIEDLELHLKIHPAYVCEKCGKGFARHTQLSSHKNVHNEPNSYVCEVCGKVYKTSDQLRRHMLTHENFSYSCTKCPKFFGTIFALRSHMKMNHERTRIWTCKVCGKIFKTDASYKTHYRQIHLREGNKKCDICGQGFYRSDYLTRHKRRHMIYGETRESFNNDAAKNQTDESVSNGTGNDGKFLSLPTGPLECETKIAPVPPGPYPCQICRKPYKRVANLQQHILSHGKPRFSCNSCSKTFKLECLLNRHERIHRNSDLSVEYRCGNCWEGFETQEELDLHYATHGNLQHKCELCGEFFAGEHLLNEHLLNVHIEDDDAEEEMRTLMMTGLGNTLYNIINME